MDHNELMHRFDYHPPSTDKVIAAHEQARELFKNLAGHFNTVLPDGREKSLAFTALEEALFWVNASIARTQLPDGDGSS